MSWRKKNTFLFGYLKALKNIQIKCGKKERERMRVRGERETEIEAVSDRETEQSHGQ